jgi:hypothetical protein
LFFVRLLPEPQPARAVPGSGLAPPPPLPRPLTRLLGRTFERAQLVALLRRPEVRMLTLTGPGGVGKTRLALEAAHDLVPDFADGVYFVPLSAISEPDFVLPAIAQALGLRETGVRSRLEELQAVLGDRYLALRHAYLAACHRSRAGAKQERGDHAGDAECAPPHLLHSHRVPEVHAESKGSPMQHNTYQRKAKRDKKSCCKRRCDHRKSCIQNCYLSFISSIAITTSARSRGQNAAFLLYQVST